jgi:hypothetical protein
MEKVKKIELMRKRIEYFYNEFRIHAMESKYYSYYSKYYRFEDFVTFSKTNYEIVSYCFYLGEFCKENRKWLSDCDSWRRYNVNDEIKKKMYCLIKSLLFEVRMMYPNLGEKRIEEIERRLDEKWYLSTDQDKNVSENGKQFLIYAFMAGLMNVEEHEIDDFWEWQEEEFRDNRISCNCWDDYTIDDSMYDALGGNMDAYWNID